MKQLFPIFSILLFVVLTDWVQGDWKVQVFRASACLLCSAYLLLGTRRIGWVLAPFVPIAAWGFIQLGFDSTVWRFATWRAALEWVAYLALCFSALQCLPLRSSLKYFAWFGGVLSLCSIALYLNWPSTGDRMLGPFLNQNHYAALMELLFPIALWRAFRDRAKAAFGLCALLMILAVAVGGSRAGMVLMFLELAYVGVRTASKPAYVLGGAVLVAALAVAIMWTRFEALATREPYDSRSATARASIRMVRDRPVLGYGLGTWANVYPAYAERDTGFRVLHADDDWLEWTAEGGIPFVLFMLSLAGFACWASWREPWCAGCVAVMLHSLVEFPLQKQAIWACFIVLLAGAQTADFRPASARRKQSS